MEVPARLGPQKSEDDEVGVAGKGVRLLDGGDEMKGVLSIDDDVLFASLIVIDDSSSLAGRCTSCHGCE